MDLKLKLIIETARRNQKRYVESQQNLFKKMQKHPDDPLVQEYVERENKKLNAAIDAIDEQFIEARDLLKEYTR